MSSGLGSRIGGKGNRDDGPALVGNLRQHTAALCSGKSTLVQSHPALEGHRSVSLDDVRPEILDERLVWARPELAVPLSLDLPAGFTKVLGPA